MQFFKRISVFLLLNFLVILSVSILLHLFHIRPYLHAYGLDVQQLLIFCAIWGMAGSLISLSLSRVIAKWMMGVKLVHPQANNSAKAAQLYHIVERLALKANLPKTPQVGIFSHPAPNAFATGPSKRKALVAVSSSLLESMSIEELEGVLAHELSHIANGDMITMTLLQGVINTFVMFFARLFAFALSNVLRSGNRKNSSGSMMSHYLLIYLFESVFMIFGFLLIAYVSRRREFRADRGSALLTSPKHMVAALTHLQQATAPKKGYEPLMIATKQQKKRGFLRLFATHPPLEDRIQALQKMPYHQTASERIS